MKTAKELFELLNSFDEDRRIEAKSASAVGKSMMETVCAFSNEPGLRGGYLLLNVLFCNQRAEEFRIEGTGRNTDVMLLVDRGIGDLKEGISDIKRLPLHDFAFLLGLGYKTAEISGEICFLMQINPGFLHPF